MPVASFIYEDTSPYIVYSGLWKFVNGTYDAAILNFSQSSYTTTNEAGAYLELHFHGKKVTIVGSKRPQQGLYQVAVDGTVFPEESAFSPAENRIWNYTMFEGEFDQRTHVLTLTNKESLFIQIDYLAWETDIGLKDEPLIVNTLQDTHPSFRYEPVGAWNTDVYRVGSFSGRTGHGTSKQAATVDISFSGDCIALYGPVSPNSTSSFSVQVNGGAVRQFKAKHQRYLPRQLLYWAAGLGAGDHSIRVINNSPIANETLAIDYAEVYTTPSLGGSLEAVSSGPVATTRSVPKAMVAGLTVSSAVALLSLFAIVVLFIRSRRAKKQGGEVTASEMNPTHRPFVPFISTQVHPPVQVAHSPVLVKSTVLTTSDGYYSSSPASPARPPPPGLERNRTTVSAQSRSVAAAPTSPLSYTSPVEELTRGLPQQTVGDSERQDARSDAPPAYKAG